MGGAILFEKGVAPLSFFTMGLPGHCEKRIFRHMLGNVGRFRERPLLHTAGKARK
jgi:hypothetical protein